VPSAPGVACVAVPELAVSEYRLPPWALRPVGLEKRKSEMVVSVSGVPDSVFMMLTVPSSPMITSIASLGICTGGSMG
jgi:hypothetical protein